MESIQLKKEVSGKRLVEMIRTASSELGFDYFHNERVEKKYPEKAILLSFGAVPTLVLQFLGIEEEKQYSSVNCQPQLGIVQLKDVDINKCPAYKPDYDAFIAKVVELSDK
jgi:hypothetical protein